MNVEQHLQCKLEYEYLKTNVQRSFGCGINYYYLNDLLVLY